MRTISQLYGDLINVYQNILLLVPTNILLSYILMRFYALIITFHLKGGLRKKMNTEPRIILDQVIKPSSPTYWKTKKDAKWHHPSHSSTFTQKLGSTIALRIFGQLFVGLIFKKDAPVQLILFWKTNSRWDFPQKFSWKITL